jgi:hypothetical protein
MPVRSASNVRPSAQIDGCPRCEGDGARACPSCAARRRHVCRLVDRDGQSLAAATARLGLTRAFAAELLAEERTRLDLAAHRGRFVDNALIRDLYERRLARDPDFTLPVLAGLAGIPCDTHLARMLGYKPTSAAVRDGRRYPGTLLTRIGVDQAARIVRALGYAPAEIEGL